MGVGIGAVVVIVAVLAAVGRSQRLRPRLGHRKTRNPVPWLLGPLAAGWLAAGIVDSVTGVLGWATGGIWDKAKDLVRGVTDWLVDWINHVVDWASRALDAVTGLAHSAYDWATTIGEWAADRFDAFWDQLTGWVGRLIGDVRGWVSGWVNQVIDWTQGLVGAVWDAVDGAYDWVRDNVWTPLWDKVEGFSRWVSDTVLPWVSDRLDDLGGFVSSSIDWLVDHVSDLVGGVTDWAAPAVGLVEACWGWLTFIAAHPFDWWVRAWHDLADQSPDTVDGMVTRAFGSGGSRVEDALVRWFD